MPHDALEPAALRTALAALEPDLVAWRRAFHAHPELSGEERYTADRIATILAAAGAEVTPRVGDHGVVGVLHGSGPGPTVGCRADMDALPIQSALDTAYKSLVLGVSHACGHDVHMAVALGTSRLLADLRPTWSGSVVFLFQPAEESLEGAQAMLDAGVLERFPVDHLLALHASPLPVGTLGLAHGLCLAGFEEFRVRFYAPAGNLDSLTEQAMGELRGLSSALPPTTPEAYSRLFEQMKTDSTLRQTVFLSLESQIEDTVPPYHLLALVSIADFEQRAAVHAEITAVLDRVVASHGASYDLALTFSNPPLRNDPSVVDAIRPALVATVGEDHVDDYVAPYPFSHEDFARFAARVPAALFWLGTANPEAGIASILHTPEYDVDERALGIGVHAMAAALLRLLDPA